MKKPKIEKSDLFLPYVILSTWFWSGLSPKAPGTFGSLAALPFAWIIKDNFGWLGLLSASVIVFCIGWYVSFRFEQEKGAEDPGCVVIDEVAGQWLVLLPAALDIKSFLVGFILFRIVDIFKPWPVCWFDRNIHGGLGIMLDDVMAAPYAMVALYLFQVQFLGS